MKRETLLSEVRERADARAALRETITERATARYQMAHGHAGENRLRCLKMQDAWYVRAAQWIIKRMRGT